MTAPRVLDWQPSTHREANDRHRLAALDCYTVGAARATISRTLAIHHLDQGQEGACTGFGLAHVLATSPAAQTPMNNEDGRTFYLQAQREDEWPGEAYDGSSVNGAMHAARTLGRIRAWRWIRTAGELRHALSYHGAVQAGSVWLDGMWDVDTDGYLTVEGAEAGGHSYSVSRYRPAPARGATAVDYWMDNSWSDGWGIGGGAWLRDVDAYRLWFSSDGELAVPTKV
jgi:hypothetical protein